MLDFIETILIKVFSILPDANPDNTIIESVNSAIILIKPNFFKLNILFPVSTLFKILMIVIFIELTLLLVRLVMKVAVFFRG